MIIEMRIYQFEMVFYKNDPIIMIKHMIKLCSQIHLPKLNPCCISVVQAGRGIDLYANVNKTGFIRLKEKGSIST